MASSLCWGCFSQLRPAPRTLLQLTRTKPVTAAVAVASFHTTTARYANPVKKKTTHFTRDTGPKFREARSAGSKKKKGGSKHGSRQTIAEAKALKTRIVLSNTNALEVPDMQDLTAENMVDSRLRGTVLGLPMDMIDRLRAAEAFKWTQGWSLFRRPGSLVRKETLELGRTIDAISQGEMKGQTVAKIITGERGTGKSLHLLQAMTMALLKQWVVIHVPEGQDLTMGHTSYSPLPDSNPTQYVQKDATAKLLTNIANANQPVLSKLHISQDHSAIKVPLLPNMSLHTMATMGAQSPEFAWPVFQGLWRELTATAPDANMQGLQPFKARPPMLVSADGLAHWMKDSKYFSVDYQPIHAHDLVFVNHFLSLLSSSKALPNGGMVLYATSTANSPTVSTFNIALKQLAARSAGVDPTSPEFPHLDPYEKLDARVLALFEGAAKDLDITPLGGLTRDEARGLMEYYARSGVLQEKITNEYVGEKWTIAGGGVVGELEKLGRRLRVLS
ncbi:hypothetical protein AJ80_00427 [Polytolypa hystricis UAMH7299]|uniref:Small ribosomal subunit protein mS29 n=1 Tax=Polytolypa hystricis (strain UAMH7299) TaxID=1447883 RepID=A0A2B7Z4V8_POLH7|nr:hypothetical protein AJ80_00427 [Polytolypa hystricis UAMH7299]